MIALIPMAGWVGADKMANTKEQDKKCQAICEALLERHLEELEERYADLLIFGSQTMKYDGERFFSIPLKDMLKEQNG